MAMGVSSLIVALVLLVSPLRAAATDPVGEIRGRIVLAFEGVRFSDLGPTAVYLDAFEGTLDFPVPTAIAKITQVDAAFSPGFLAITTGQTVEMPNSDPFFHNVFSYSKPNDFDLDLYSMGESRSVTFHHPGVVRIYCSIHESMRGLILVSPSPWFDQASHSGEFRLRNVPPGRYRLRTFNEPFASAVRDVTVVAGETSVVEVIVGAEPAGAAQLEE